MCVYHFILSSQYISTAVSLARDLPRLISLRASLRSSMVNSPLCQGREFTRGLEQIYEQLWEKYCNQPATTVGESSVNASTVQMEK